MNERKTISVNRLQAAIDKEAVAVNDLIGIQSAGDLVEAESRAARTQLGDLVDKLNKLVPGLNLKKPTIINN